MVTYYNLTQCSGDRVVYFRSTDVEQKNYHRLLWSVPDEWLYFLYIGVQIKVVDRSSNKGKIEHIFIPVLNDLLNVLISADYVPQCPNLKAHLLLAQDALNKDSSLSKKFTGWTGRMKSPIRIDARTIHVDSEYNPIFENT